jgi:hypothetical protein
LNDRKAEKYKKNIRRRYGSSLKRENREKLQSQRIEPTAPEIDYLNVG